MNNALLLFAAAAAAAIVVAVGARPVAPPQSFPHVELYVVPHSHLDAGWLFTVDQYYTHRVRGIYDSVVAALAADPARRFIAVEVIYFSRWFEEGTPAQRATARRLVAAGQLEFIIGGWTMPDEAGTTYSTNVDQLTLGHAWIVAQFGESAVARYGWQIDPFGASTVLHRHYLESGFRATVTSRVGFATKADMEASRGFEFTWFPSAAAPDRGIFTHVLDRYGYPTAVGALRDNGMPPVTQATAPALAAKVVANAHERAAWFRTEHVLFPWGNDFNHFNGTWDFDNMDALLAQVNAGSASHNVTARYAVLSEFFDALAAATTAEKLADQALWPVRNATDFFPYADVSGYTWSGYFSSRSALKGLVRTTEALLRAAEQLVAAVPPASDDKNEAADFAALAQLRAAAAEATHHDATPGTAEPFVVKNYDDDLLNATAAAAPLVAARLAQWVAAASPGALPPQASLTLDQAAALDGLGTAGVTARVPVVLYNSLAWPVTRFIELAVDGAGLAVTSLDGGSTLPAQVLPSADVVYPPGTDYCQAPESCGEPPGGRRKPYALFFEVALPPAGYTVVLLVSDGSGGSGVPDPVPVAADAPDVTLTNGVVTLTFEAASGRLASMAAPGIAAPVRVAQDVVVYRERGRLGLGAGAYVFKPRGAAEPLVAGRVAALSVVGGPLVTEVRQTFTEPCAPSSLGEEIDAAVGDDDATAACGVTQTFRVFRSADPGVAGVVELVASVGPIAPQVDVALRFNTSLRTNRVFYSDDNCFEMQRRTAQDPARTGSPIAGQFFPSVCASFLRDDDGIGGEDSGSDAAAAAAQLTLLFDRAHAVSGALADGAVEAIVHRRTLSSDLRGPLVLNDRDALQRVRTLLLLANASASAASRPAWTARHNFPPVLAFAPRQPLVRLSATGGELAAAGSSSSSSSWLAAGLAPAAHLLTLQRINATAPLLVRIAHVGGDAQDVGAPAPAVAVPLLAALQPVLAGAGAATLVERTLTGALPVAEAAIPARAPVSAAGVVPLAPTDIRTFFVV